MFAADFFKEIKKQYPRRVSSVDFFQEIKEGQPKLVTPQPTVQPSEVKLPPTTPTARYRGVIPLTRPTVRPVQPQPQFKPLRPQDILTMPQPTTAIEAERLEGRPLTPQETAQIARRREQQWLKREPKWAKFDRYMMSLSQGFTRGATLGIAPPTQKSLTTGESTLEIAGELLGVSISAGVTRKGAQLLARSVTTNPTLYRAIARGVTWGPIGGGFELGRQIDAGKIKP